MTRKRSSLKGAFAGAIGGALGTVLLNVVQKLSLEGTRKVENAIPHVRKYTQQQEQLLDTFERAHVATAEFWEQHAAKRQEADRYGSRVCVRHCMRSSIRRICRVSFSSNSWFWERLRRGTLYRGKRDHSSGYQFGSLTYRQNLNTTYRRIWR